MLFLNLIIVFLTIFTGNLTRKLELTNDEIKKNIGKQKEQLTINQIEFSFYNNPNYLKKLHNIYFSLDENFSEKKIFSLSNITNISNQRVLLANIQLK